MPYTFNGCGTTYYGKRDVGPDGSYVCTEWITFVYLPLIPVRSLRVLPTKDGTNLIVWRSQSYQTMKVPLSWPQICNTYGIFTIPILALIIGLNWSDLNGWVHHNLLYAKAPLLKVEAAPVESPLDPVSAMRACGSELKLDEQTFVKLNLYTRLTNLVKESNFSTDELKYISKPDDLEEDAFSGYAAGYVTWNKPEGQMRSDLVQKMKETVNTGVAKLSGSDAEGLKDYGNKDVEMIVKAFDMGRHDGRTSPCPY